MTALTHIFIIIQWMTRFVLNMHANDYHINYIANRVKGLKSTMKLWQNSTNDVNIWWLFFLPHLLEKMIFKWLLSLLPFAFPFFFALVIMFFLYVWLCRVYILDCCFHVYQNCFFANDFFTIRDFGAWLDVYYFFFLSCLFISSAYDFFYRNIWFKFMDSISDCL